MLLNVVMAHMLDDALFLYIIVTCSNLIYNISNNHNVPFSISCNSTWYVVTLIHWPSKSTLSLQPRSGIIHVPCVHADY